MNENNMEAPHGSNCQCGTCACGMCRHCHGHFDHGRFFVLRWILGLLILAIVFFVGIKVGEFKADIYGSFGAGYYGGYQMAPGYPMMRQPRLYQYQQGWDMMQQPNSAPQYSPSAPQ